MNLINSYSNYSWLCNTIEVENSKQYFVSVIFSFMKYFKKTN